MRFLIVSAVLACATAAPSGLLAPLPVAALPGLVYSAAVPTIPPGDVQAAVIDAQVKAYDEAIAAADKARELSELATENLKTEVVTGTDIVNENAQEGFWSAQEKQWQAVDAIKTAEAKLDGAIASSAPILAKNAVLGAYIAGVAPISPIVYTPGVVAPVVKSVDAKAEPAAAEPAKVEEAKPEEKQEALTKSAEEIKEEKDSVAIEASKENLEAKPQLAPIISPIAIQPYAYPIVAPVALSAPVLKYGAIPQIALYPAIGKTSW